MHEQRVTWRLEDLQITEIPEVLRVASELYARDREEIERAAQHRELLNAAAEAGLPAEYLDRAAGVIQARRAARHRRQRRSWVGTAALMGLALALATTRLVVQSPSAPPPQLPPLPIMPAALPPPVLPVGSFSTIDLSEQANYGMNEPMLDTDGNDLTDLGTGTKLIAGVPFLLGGVVVVGPRQTEGGLTEGPVEVPEGVPGIPIGQKVHRLYFLHATHFVAKPGTLIGGYIVHYADGGEEETPIVYGEDVLDWWARADANRGAALSQIVWTGSNEAASRHGVGIRLFMKTWTNPEPDREIQSLEMVTGDQSPGQGAPAPFLVAVTAR